MLIDSFKARIMTISFLCFFMFVASPSMFFSEASEDKSQQITVDNQPLEEVIDLLAQRSEYTIHLIGEHNIQKISGTFYLSDMELTLRRIFRNTNTFIEFDNKQKSIVVKLPKAGPVSSFLATKSVSSGTGKIDIDTGLTHDELLAIRESERQIRLQRMSDPNEIDPDTGNSYVKQLVMRKSEKKEHLAKADDMHEIDPFTGRTNYEQIELREMEKKLHIAKATNHDEIDPSVGLSYADQLLLREKEAKERIARLSSSTEEDPETGMTDRELLDIRDREKIISSDAP